MSQLITVNVLLPFIPVLLMNSLHRLHCTGTFLHIGYMPMCATLLCANVTVLLQNKSALFVVPFKCVLTEVCVGVRSCGVC